MGNIMQSAGSSVKINTYTKSELVDELERMMSDGIPTLILITRSRAEAFSLQDKIAEWVKKTNVMHYDRIEPNPTVGALTKALNAVSGFRPERIIVFGGGSAIDTAKGISALLYAAGKPYTEGSVREAIRSKQYAEHTPACRITAIPTTAGSGSDVTHWATIWDPDNHQKLSIDCPGLLPEADFLVPEFHTGMSLPLTLSTGLDALSHALEAFWSRARNHDSQMHAVKAVTGIALTLPDVLRDPGNVLLRKQMLENALSAGLAFSSTRTTACHSISYPLTMRYGIAHGFACALTLYPVAKRNMAAVPEIAQILDPFGGIEGFRDWLEQSSSGIQQLRLSAWNVPEEDLPLIAREAFTKGRMDNNPVPFTEEDVQTILKECY